WARLPRRSTAAIRCAHEDEAACALPLLDAAGPRTRVQLFRLAEVLRAIEAGMVGPNSEWECRNCPFPSQWRPLRLLPRLNALISIDKLDERPLRRDQKPLPLEKP